MDNVHKLKNLLVSSCQSIKAGNRDIAVNLLEIAADLMEAEEITPEVIETQFITQVNTEVQPTEFEQASEEDMEVDTFRTVTEEELRAAATKEDMLNTALGNDDTVTEQASHTTLRDIISKWGISNDHGAA